MVEEKDEEKDKEKDKEKDEEKDIEGKDFWFLEDTARKLNGKQHLEEADVTAGKFAKDFGRQLPFCSDSRLPGSIGGAIPRESSNHQGEAGRLRQDPVTLRSIISCQVSIG